MSSRSTPPFRADHVGSLLRRPDDLTFAYADQVQAIGDLDQLCLAPQCGFSSTVDGNAPTRSQQAGKPALVVETAREV